MRGGDLRRLREAFDAWLAEHAVTHDPPDVIAAALATMFDADVDLTGVACAAVIDADVQEALEAVLVEHFVEIARAGYQFERFEDAWCAWADADAAIDWTEERLQDTVEILTAGRDHAGRRPGDAVHLRGDDPRQVRHALPGVDGHQHRRRHSLEPVHRLRPAEPGAVRRADLRRGRRRARSGRC